jgi:hypothetical protein
MTWLLPLLRGLGAAGAAANARAELDSARSTIRQAEIVACRVNAAGSGVPLTPAPAAQAA